MPEVLDVVCDLLGPDIRFDHSKLNCKPPAGGVPIEWHQDWAFYPQTNDCMLALSLMLDDCDLENGPLLVIPGSHRGPAWDHHYEGRFIGAIDPATADFDESSALALVGPAGSVAIHHVRTVHGSADSISGRQRRLLNMNYATTATWPLLGLDTVPATHEPGIEGFHATTVRGNATFEPRMESLPVRIPLPSADAEARTIFDMQMPAYGRSFRKAPPRSRTPGPPSLRRSRREYRRDRVWSCISGPRIAASCSPLPAEATWGGYSLPLLRASDATPARARGTSCEKPATAPPPRGGSEGAGSRPPGARAEESSRRGLRFVGGSAQRTRSHRFLQWQLHRLASAPRRSGTPPRRPLIPGTACNSRRV